WGWQCRSSGTQGDVCRVVEGGQPYLEQGRSGRGRGGAGDGGAGDRSASTGPPAGELGDGGTGEAAAGTLVCRIPFLVDPILVRGEVGRGGEQRWRRGSGVRRRDDAEVGCGGEQRGRPGGAERRRMAGARGGRGERWGRGEKEIRPREG
ncbi:unnamed protein product, partial [Urochloa humidicola]